MKTTISIVAIAALAASFGCGRSEIASEKEESVSATQPYSGAPAPPPGTSQAPAPQQPAREYGTLPDGTPVRNQSPKTVTKQKAAQVESRYGDEDTGADQ